MSGRELLKRRVQLGRTQAELARELGVHKRTVSRWERGVCPIPHAVTTVVWYVLKPLLGKLTKRV